MNPPTDQCLFLTVFTAVCLTVILAAWLLMPVYHHDEFYEGEEPEHVAEVNRNLVLSPDKLIRKANEAILTGEAALVQLEAEEEKGKSQ